MDTYSKTWLEFVFPLYILTLVIAIIIGSRWSSKLAWLCKRNAVPVLATLILLSYTKCLSTILIIFSSTRLSVENSTLDNPELWLADSNDFISKGQTCLPFYCRDINYRSFYHSIYMPYVTFSMFAGTFRVEIVLLDQQIKAICGC